MANIATWAIRDRKAIDKYMAAELVAFVRWEKHYDDGGVDDNGRRMWPRRSDAELEREFWEYVAPAKRAAEEERIRARSYDDMKRAWEYQALFMKAKTEVSEALGVENATKTYFITVRPDCTKVSFREFHDKVVTLMDRACFHTYILSFEQKGLEEADLGKGFHVHIIAKMSQRSKTEVLRDIKSSFAAWLAHEKIAENCIEVDPCKNPKEHAQRYLVDYQSKDGHKAPTKEWDAKWREREGLQPLYTTESPVGHLPIKSTRQVTVNFE